MHYYEVAPTKIIRATSGVFTYSSNLSLAIGQIVTVPVGKQLLTGVVMHEVAQPAYETRAIANVLDLPPLPRALIHTVEWMSHYYTTHLAIALQPVLPRGLTKKRRDRQSDSRIPKRERTHFLLNKQQSAAVEALRNTTSGTTILHGITGSGKTAVYIEYAKLIIESGRSVIVLVPEIALTSQLVSEFEAHFPDVLLTHSRQTEAQRHLAWLDALNSGKPRIIIGPRSALFLPLESVGAIIIDEAHEPSFKQDQSPRYSSLRVASVLAKAHNGVVIQGSATPLISEYYLAQETGRTIIQLTERARADAVDPDVSVVDMTNKSSFTRHRFISNELIAALGTQLERGSQSLIFHNRRGSASTTLCDNCGWSASCPRCFVPLTLHADAHVLRCHICNFAERVLTSCPVCASTEIIHKGIGTKLVESELRKLFPAARIVRFDGDTADQDTLENRYQELYDGDIDIIIGTQVVAKGLDLPHLRLVGVIQADAGLMLPDYMASERTFQLLAQVVGRVGRSRHSASVIIQSYQPGASAVRFGIAQDFDSFYHEAIAERRRAKFPPFTYLLKLTCIYKTEAAAARNAATLATSLRRAYPDITIFGPTPSFYERQHDTYRWQVIVKSTQRPLLEDIVTNHLPPTHWQYDLDPMSLL